MPSSLPIGEGGVTPPRVRSRRHDLRGPFFEAVSGGSSRAITSLLIQAMQDNPYVVDCGGVKCSEVEAGRSYMFVVDGYDESAGAFEAVLECGEAGD